MKTKVLISIISTSILISCGNSNNKTQQYAEKTMLDSLRFEKEKQLELEILKLKEQGIFGKWECIFSGYESTIYLQKEGNNYSTTIDFIKNNSETKHENLTKNGEKYLVADSKAKEYYIINSDGNLELWDEDGLFTIAKNIMPGQKTKSLPEFNIKNTIGENIFTVVGNYSKSSPKTLSGTDNKYWIVYYKDIDITFKVYKRTDTIEKAKKGELPYFKQIEKNKKGDNKM